MEFRNVTSILGICRSTIYNVRNNNDDLLGSVYVTDEYEIVKMSSNSEEFSNYDIPNIIYRVLACEYIMTADPEGQLIMNLRIGDSYYFIDDSGEVSTTEWTGSLSDVIKLMSGNVLYDQYNQFSEQVIKDTLKLRMDEIRDSIISRMSNEASMQVELTETTKEILSLHDDKELDMDCITPVIDPE